MALDIKTEKAKNIYSRSVLFLYNFWVLSLSNRFIWRCPTKIILNHFNKNVTSNHLDVGVGTGYFLNKCRLPSNNLRIGLMDLNDNCLNFASRKLKRYSPEIYKHNVFEELSDNIAAFDSISVNFLLHCLPGNLREKLSIFNNLDKCLNKGGNIFGSTILPCRNNENWFAKKLMEFYNSRSIFNNINDNYNDLEEFLALNYNTYEIKVIGNVVLFEAYK